MADGPSTSVQTTADAVHCKLCLSDCPAATVSRLRSCDCVFCTRCLCQYVQQTILTRGGDPITCPDLACKHAGVLLDSEIASFATADQAELYQRLKFMRGVQLDPSKSWCPVLECQAVCNVMPSAEGTPVPMHCPECHAVFCCECRELWEDSHFCSQHPLVVPPANDSGMPHADAPIKQCPKCRVYIERNQGCAQMLCKSCKHTFCWYCLQNLDGDIFLRHYDKGPCRYRLGHSRASVMWNRTQVAGILVGISVIVLVTSPLLLLASPCILCCVCKPCHRTKDKKSKNKTTTTREREPSASIA
ncbi:E3 ubiquitin-protein ligase RNF144B [Electrophorus electricus]|uniref:E3 ubiquitin-protein ligase RNF144B n=1 Tax=Electrophorus electricus TaxID=8005 RepID=A0A4W4EAY4_ELEEL|nr:E3 ubiquitin-protein ligase RNF144B [Electrophorus electricus]XP_026865308.2 E3 ubiquitin-protein ligase RNF144B [Electrophorus electricus]XP_026865309.2 E3 ubiquitin-protein ligase RNF144B [Electrophorus electricus]